MVELAELADRTRPSRYGNPSSQTESVETVDSWVTLIVDEVARVSLSLSLILFRSVFSRSCCCLYVLLAMNAYLPLSMANADVGRLKSNSQAKLGTIAYKNGTTLLPPPPPQPHPTTLDLFAVMQCHGFVSQKYLSFFIVLLNWVNTQRRIKVNV